MNRFAKAVLSFFGEWLQIIGAFTEALFEEHRLVRRGLVLWSIWEIHRVISRFVELMTEINTATVAGVSAIIGILATVSGFYIKSRELDQKS